MAGAGALPEAGQGKLAANIMHFARALRAAGLPIGPGRVLDAIRAVEVAGIRRRDDFYWSLHAVFVNRQDQRELFDQAFHVFWRDPKLLERMMSLLLPQVPGMDEAEQARMSQRLAEAFAEGKKPGEGEGGDEESAEVEIEATLTYSDRDLLREKDFESMSSDELTLAKLAIARMRLPIMRVATRRFQADAQGARVDMRATLRAGLRSGAAIIPLRRRPRIRRPPPLVILCDISGSMARYSRMFVLFLHAVTNDRDRVHTFLFGTRLTNVTRHLRHRDVDVALEKVSAAVEDWDGGTRIGSCLKEFNTYWGRRVLGQGALVLLISDGLDRDAAAGLEVEIERLHKSCRRLICLNPLLRYEGFEAKSMGVKAILPHVDDFRPVHNLASLADLAEALSHEGPRHEESAAAGRKEVA
jgi:uncharacterized protein with von Willebrand factor type A (vWA) domain